MATRLNKTTFARLFPAMREPDIASDFLAKQEDEPFVYDPNEYVDAVDKGGSGGQQFPQQPSPPTNPSTVFQLPPGAFSMPQMGRTSEAEYEGGVDPYDLSTLARIGQAASKGQRYDDSMDRLRSRVMTPIQPVGDHLDNRQRSGANSGTGSDGRPYVDPADRPPPELPAHMQPKRPKSALQSAKEMFEATRDRKIEDKNKSVGGRLLEVVENFTKGIAEVNKANPRAHWSAMLAGGGARAAAGSTIDRTLNEREAHEVDLARTQRDYELAKGVAKDEEALAVSASKRAVDEYEAMTKREKLIYDQIDEGKKNVLSQLRDIDEIDPDSKDPRVQAFIKQAAAAGVIVTKKSKNSKFSFDITPDGQLIIGDTTTGSYKKGQGNYSKPPSFTANELPESMFGILSDDEINDRATAAVGKEFPNRRLRPERVSQLKEMRDEAGNPLYLNPDGSVNDAKALSDGILDEGAYENGPDNYEQRRAAARNELRASQASLRTEVANFRTAVSNQRPRSDAQEQPISKVKDLFLRIMQLPPKQRTEKLKAFYANLPNIRITG